MTTPPPPPPPEPSPRPATPTASPGREPWWTGGRVAIAIVLVLVLTGGAGVVGFFAGVAVGGSDSFVDALDDAIAEGDLDVDDDTAGVPGFTPLDAAAEPGTAIGPGDSVVGELRGTPVDHPMALDQTATVSIEVTSTDFDTVLVLLDGAGELVDSDDDGAETGTDSRLDLELDAGTYTVRVQSWGSGGEGAYTLVVD